MSPEPVQLPNGVVTAYGVSALDATGSEGELVRLVILSVEFQAAPGMSASQNFILHKDDARDLRAGLKKPRYVAGEVSIEEIQ